MLFKNLFAWVLMVLLFHACMVIGCIRKQDRREEIAIEKVPPPKVTVLADLPDSLQPVVTYLEDRPEPKLNIFPLPAPSRIFKDSLTGQYLPKEFHGNGIFTHYTTEDGLGHDYVHSCYKDKSGNLWFGTVGGGATRFDGKTFTNFSTTNGLISNVVWGITEDISGNLWFGTMGGVSRYDGNSFTNYTTEQGLAFNDVGRAEVDYDGHLWFSTIGGGVSRFDGTTFKNFNEKNGLNNKFIFSIEIDHAGMLWVGTRGDGVYQYPRSAGETGRFEKFDGPDEWDQDIVYTIYQDQKRRIWFGMQYNGLYCLENGKFKHYTSRDGLGCETISHIAEDRSGTIWVSTCQGLSQFRDSVFVTFSAINGLPNPGIGSVIEDNSGYIWLTTKGDGIARYEGAAFSKWVNGQVASNTSAIFQDSTGYLWYGTNADGITRYDGKEWITFSTDQGLARNAINFIEQDSSKRIWFSTYYGGGLSCMEIQNEHVDPKTSTNRNSNAHYPQVKLTNYTKEQGLPHDALYGITEDQYGNFWIATYGGGVTYFDGKSFTTYTSAQGLASNEVWDVFEDSRGNIWIMYVIADGLTLYDGKSFTNFTKAQGLPSMSVWRGIEDDKGNLWFTSEEGLILLRESEVKKLSAMSGEQEYASTVLFESFSTKDGLPDNYINYIESDPEGNLTICTNAGYTILKGGLDAFDTPGGIIHYGAKEGFPFRSASSSFKDKDGIIWVVTNSNKTGLVRVDPGKFNVSVDTPVLSINNILIHNQPVVWSHLKKATNDFGETTGLSKAIIRNEEVIAFSRELNTAERDSMRIQYEGVQFDTIASWYPVPSGLVLPYHLNDITFNFNAVVTTRHSMVEYQYFLEGYDADWSQPSSASYATFGNMREGSYTFSVRAKSPEGIWTAPVEYNFRVLPPMHRTWWAYSLYGVLIGSIIYSGFRLQKRNTIRAEQQKAGQKQAILNERLRISRDLHDEVGATLSGISMYSHLAKEQMQHQNKDAVVSSLTIMQESSGEMVNKLSDIIWLLNPEHAQLYQLLEKLEEYAAGMSAIKNMQFVSELSPALHQVELSLEVRRGLYLIFKEAINNAVKYSQASIIRYTVKPETGMLDFTLEDNGIGFRTDMVRSGNGLRNMQQRADEIGAAFELKQAEGGGTLIRVRYKIT